MEDIEKQQLRSRLRDIRRQLHDMPGRQPAPPPADRHQTIELLHRYNAVKDAAQAVIGVLANHKQCTVAALHREYGLPLE